MKKKNTWWVLILMGIVNFNVFSQQLDTLKFPAGQHGKIDILHTRFLREQLFPSLEIMASPSDLRVMNNFYLGHSEEVKLRFKNSLIKGDFAGMYGRNLVSTSLRPYIKPYFIGGISGGYYVIQQERKWKDKIPVFVGSSKNTMRRKVYGEKEKLFLIGPVLGFSSVRYDSKIVGYNVLGQTYVAGNATIASLTAGLVIDMATGFTTQADGKMHSFFRRSSFHLNAMFGINGEFDYYNAFAGNALSTEPKLDMSSFDNLTFRRLGWNLDYAYSFGHKSNTNLYCAVYVAQFPKQIADYRPDFRTLEDGDTGIDLTFGARVGIRIGNKI